MKKRKILLLASLLLTVNLIAQKETSDQGFTTMLNKLLSHTVKEVLPNEIKNDSTYIFLDAREKQEYNVSHIQNALWVGYENFKPKILKDIPKDRPIIVYCTVGYRSEKIAEKLLKNGYTDVSNLYGGIFEWVHNNKKVSDGNTTTYKIHTYNKEWSKWLKKGEKIYQQ
ncbi:rhodanese-like domain-containing protein [Aquimarina agarilytica]|uniref:rhodanese-like domain-containing protein n=1 Tax=Aquimarina agarilytica TaxID=1087449 RepID=UPI000288A63E|nr:rhodanese-like domain-containing protein [Aquimarina agarilytica]